MEALRVWRCYLEGGDFTVVTDHRPITFFNSQPALSRRQARWLEALTRSKFSWEYRPGRVNVADPLSRCPIFAMVLTRRGRRALDQTISGPSQADIGQSTQADAELDQFAQPNQQQEVLPQADAEEVPADFENVLDSAAVGTIPKQILAGYAEDPWFQDATNTADLYQEDDFWYRVDPKTGNKQIVVPAVQGLKEKILYEVHDSELSGHLGIDRTLELLLRHY